MKRYYFELLDESFTSLGANIADGSNKNTALNAAKRFMKANGLIYAQLQVNSMLTDNILDIIDIDLTEEAEPAQPQAEQEAAAEPTATSIEYSAALADMAAYIEQLGQKIEDNFTAVEDLQKECDDFGRRLAKIRAEIEAEEAADAAETDQPEAPEQVASKLQASCKPADQPQAATTYRVNIVDGCTNYETQEISIGGITDLWQAKNHARAMMAQIAALTGFDLTTDNYGYCAADRSGDNVYVARIFNEQTNQLIEL